jgi:hypothetical protein
MGHEKIFLSIIILLILYKNNLKNDLRYDVMNIPHQKSYLIN